MITIFDWKAAFGSEAPPKGQEFHQDYFLEEVLLSFS
jgi:hypothetical protein